MRILIGSASVIIIQEKISNLSGFTKLERGFHCKDRGFQLVKNLPAVQETQV